MATLYICNTAYPYLNRFPKTKQILYQGILKEGEVKAGPLIKGTKLGKPTSLQTLDNSAVHVIHILETGTFFSLVKSLDGKTIFFNLVCRSIHLSMPLLEFQGKLKAAFPFLTPNKKHLPMQHVWH